MTPIPHIDRVAEFDEWRDGVASSLGSLADLADTPWEVVGRIELFPGQPLSGARIVVPEAWLPAGPSRRLSNRTLDLAGLGPSCADDEASARWDESLRKSVLAVWLPRRTNTGIRSYKPTSWLTTVRYMIRAAEWQRKNRPDASGSIWSHLTPTDVLAMQAEMFDGEKGRTEISKVMRWLAAAGQRRVLVDAPGIFDPSDLEASDGEAAIESSAKGDAPVRAKKLEDRTFQPFSDDFVTQVLWRARWLQENLSTQLLACWDEQRAIVASFAEQGVSSSNPRVIDVRRAALARIDWRDGTGKKIERLPFAIAQKIGKDFKPSDAWPPSNGATITLMVGVLQALNLCLVAFCTGARASEIGAANEASLVFAPGQDDARLLARTFKLVDAIGGQARDWPLHPVAAKALAIQSDLARRVKPEDTDHLWVLAGKAGSAPLGSPLLNLTEVMVSAMANLGITDLAGKDRAHAHRWRHTVGRIVALSVVNSPQVLLDLFGHRDLEMTLRYMLSHPEIAEDAQRVARETAFVMAEEAVAETLASTAGGPAAATLARGLDDLRMRRGEDAFGVEDLRELTDVLTFGGKQWQIVRPGVLCTKAPGQFGPCTQGRGTPDPGSCRTTCDHRLETTRAKAQCSQAIGALLVELDDAAKREETMVVANLAGQVLAQLERWEDIRNDWLGRSPTAQRLWEGHRS